MSRTTFAIIIPARLDSKRLPRKVLLKRTGKYLIQHVWEQLEPFEKSGSVIIATDSEEVKRAAESFGARSQITSANHPSGTDRVAEVAEALDVSVIVNVQGDEPNLNPEDIQGLIDSFERDGELRMATLATRRTDSRDQQNPNIVKVVTDKNGYALYFSRAPIPFGREESPQWLHHIGIYAYRKDLLMRLSSLKPTTLEGFEKLEQLRVLEHGYRIKVILTDKSYEGIDTKDQYDKFVAGFCTCKDIGRNRSKNREQ